MNAKFWELKSEFAHVRVELNLEGNGPRVTITDLKTMASIDLDPLELESLAWVSHDDLAPIVNPSFRWYDENASIDRQLRGLGISNAK